MCISTDREKSCVPRGRTSTGAASATSTRTRRRRVSGAADAPDAAGADASRAEPPLSFAKSFSASEASPDRASIFSSVFSSAIAWRSPSTNDAHSATKRARYTTRREDTRANAAASARSAASPSSNVSHDASTRRFFFPGLSSSACSAAAARTTTRQGWSTGRRGSATRRLPIDARKRIVEGYSTSSARRDSARASATHPGETAVSDSATSSASSSRSATRNASTRAETRVAARDFPVSSDT